MMKKAVANTFDSQGRRTEYKSVTNGAQNTWLRFLYDGYLCVQVLYSNEPYNVFKEFVWDPTEPVATRPLVFRYAPNSLNLFYAFDGNKNVSDVFYRMTSNGIGAHYDYAPFGGTTRTHRDSSASFDIVTLNPFRFSSEYYDSELDLVYYNYRHYSSSLGRFLSRDPIEEQGGWNLYLFTENNIFSKQESLGLFSFLSKGCCNGKVYYKNRSGCCGGVVFHKWRSNRRWECCIDEKGCHTNEAEKGRIYRFDKKEGTDVYLVKQVGRANIPFLLKHAWLRVEDLKVGFYPHESDPFYPFYSPGGSSKKEEEEKWEGVFRWTKEREIRLSPCLYDAALFKECVSSTLNRQNRETYWLIGNNCLDWAEDVIDACKKEARRSFQ